MQRMDRLRRSLRESFRRKKDHGPESSKPHQWQADEEAVRAGNCTFHVKYLGCVEVFESRGMQVCEEAMKVLRASRRRPVKANLYVSGDGLRVVEDDTKGLIVDQTIEKVSFCAPDRNHERGFSYICRDGTTRRWMCHGFLASRDSGERLSHAVGCAFAVCLERKQKREKECGVTMTYDSKTSTFTRSGSFRVSTMTETNNKANNVETPTIPPPAPVKRILPTAAIERPHAPPKMLERQGSFRGFSQLSNHSPFKRQLSLRLNELPSNLQRTQGQNVFGSVQNSNQNQILNLNLNNSSQPVSSSPAPPPRLQRGRLRSLPAAGFGAPTIPEGSGSSTASSDLSIGPPSKVENKDKDPVSELCQQVSQGLSLLAANHDVATNSNCLNKNHTSTTSTSDKFQTKFTNPWDDEVPPTSQPSLPIFNTSALATANAGLPSKDSWINNLTQSHEPKAPLQPKIAPIKENIPVKSQKSNNVFEPSHPVPSNSNNLGASKPLQRVMHKPAPPRSQSLGSDPFDADWATPLARTGQTPTNPFARQQTFQISM